RVPFASLHRSGNGLTPHRGFDDLVYLSDAQSITRRIFPLDLVVDVVAAGDALEESAASSLHALQHLLHLKTDILDCFKLRSHHLDADRSANARGDHVDSSPNREQPRICERRDLHRTIELVDQSLPTDWRVLGPPSRELRLQPLRRP